MIRTTTPPQNLVRRSLFTTLVAPLFAVACLRASPSVMPDSEGGIFEFVANIGSEALRGTMVVTQDTIILQTGDAQCIPVSYSGRNSQNLTYNCRGNPSGRLIFDRRHPASQSKWYGTVTRTAVRTVCDQWTVSSTGRRVCAVSRTEHYEQSTPISGMIKTRRLTAG